MQDQKTLFENWADSYEKYVLENQHSFPFKGYSELVDEIVKTIKPYSTILDLGIGTGYIAQKLYTEKKCPIYGIDLSEKMVAISKNRMKDAHIIQFDFDKYQDLDWSIFPKNINYFIGTYFFHHYNDENKIKIIDFLLNHVNPKAKIIIGDIGFQNHDLFIESKNRLAKEWDESEYYFDLESFKKFLEGKNLKFESKIISEFCIYLEIWK
jgi:putative AdoMet-dependent methyltransferase